MLTALLLIAPFALADASRDRAEDSRDRREDAQDRREDQTDARHQGGTADRREDARDRHEDVRDRQENVRDRHDGAPARGHAAAYAPRHTPAYGPRRAPAYAPRRGPPNVVVVNRAPARRSAPPPAAKRPAPTHDFVLSVDAVEAVNGMADVTGEINLAPRAGLVLEAGLGANPDGALYTVGTQVRTYITGGFDGGLYLGLGGNFGTAHAFAPTSPGFSVGPALGAKHTFDVPVTLQASVGIDGVWTADYHGVLPTVSVGLGWAF